MVNKIVVCPICSEIKHVDISEEELESNPRGIVAVNLYKDDICPHSLVAYIDRTMNVRDCFPIDFQIELPQINFNKVTTDASILNFETRGIDFIKINILPITLTYIIRSFIYDKKILLINEESFLTKYILDFLKFTFMDSFKFLISIVSSHDFNKHKHKYKEFLVIDGKNVLKDRGMVLDRKELKIELNIVYKFFIEHDPKLALIVLKNEIQKVYIFSEAIKNFIINFEKRKVSSNLILKDLKSRFDVEIPKDYLNFLMQVVNNYFKCETSFVYENFLDFI